MIAESEWSSRRKLAAARWYAFCTAWTDPNALCRPVPASVARPEINASKNGHLATRLCRRGSQFLRALNAKPRRLVIRAESRHAAGMLVRPLFASLLFVACAACQHAP